MQGTSRTRLEWALFSVKNVSGNLFRSVPGWGIILNTIEFCIPEDKIHKLHGMLDKAIESKHCSYRFVTKMTVALISSAIRHLPGCTASGNLITPEWKSVYF